MSGSTTPLAAGDGGEDNLPLSELPWDEEALRWGNGEDLRRWFGLLDQMPVAVSVLALDGSQLYGNTAYRRLFRVEGDAITTLRVEAISRPEDHDWTKRYLQLLADGRTGELVTEKEYQRLDGTGFTGRLSARALRGPGGAAIGFLGVISDVSEQRSDRVRRELSDTKLRRVLEAQRELVCEWSPADGQVVYANSAYLQFFGYGTDVIGRSLMELISPRFLEEQEEINARMLGGMDAHRTERTYDDGRTVSWSDTVVRDVDGGAPTVVSVGRDITERNRMIADLRASERRFRLLLGNLAGVLSVYDGSGNRIESTGRQASPSGEDATDLSRGFERVHPADLQLLLEFRQEVLVAPGAEAHAEIRFRNDAGVFDTYDLTAVNLLDDPVIEGVVLTSRNVSAQKAIESELAARRDEALERQSRTNAFTAMVSHELRNPLHALLALMELLDEQELPDATRALSSALHRQASGLRRIVDDLLEFGRLDAGHVQLAPSVFDVREVSAEIVALCRAANPNDSDIELVIDAGVPPSVRMDRERFTQVLGNLVGNAAKFTREGTVIVRVGSTGARARSSLRFEVIDEGPGIGPGDRERIFDPFVQIDGQSGGSGLGLAIVKRIIAAMGGSVGVTDAPTDLGGTGSAFWFEIPLDVAGPATDIPETRDSAEPGTGMQVLVVEDDPTNQMVAQRQLERLGATVVLTSSGPEALLEMARHHYDLVLMDYLLPGIDGLEITRRVRALEQGSGRHLVIVAVTASVTRADREACLDAGMDDFLPKPVGLQELRRLLERWRHGREEVPEPAPISESVEVPAIPPSSVPSRAHGAVDTERLASLVEDMGSRESVEALVRRFLGDLDQREQGVVDALATGDHTAVRPVAHTLKSVARLVGLDALGRLCETIERAADVESASAELPQLHALCAQGRDALRSWLGDHE